MKMTIRKLAEIAGVSRGTVDKVLHNRAGVSDTVRQRVLAVIEEQGYQLPSRKKDCVHAKERSIHISVIIPRLYNDFFYNMKKGMDDALQRYKEHSITTEFFHCNSEDINEVLSILQFVQEKQMDGIILRGCQSHRLCDKLNLLAERGVPIILIDSDIIGCRKLCFVGEDSKASGRVAASLLAKCIGGEGEVAIIGGMSEISGHRLRIQGFQQAVAERFPHIRIVETINSYDQGVIAYQKTIQLLRQHPNLKGIFSAVGCTADIGQALLDKNKTVKIVSYNITPDIVRLVKKGIIEFTIGLTPYNQGTTAVTTLLDYILKGQPPKSTFVEIPSVICMDENIDSIASKNTM